MKKILLTALVSCVAIGVFAQGQVQFRNWVASPAINAPVGNALTGTLLNGSNTDWRAALIGGPTTGTAASISLDVMGTLQMLYNPTTTTLTWVNFRTGTTPPAADGYVNVGTQAARVVPGVDWGGTALVQMVAWQGPYTTWAEAWAAAHAGGNVLIGVSNPLTLTLPTAPSSPTLTYLVGLNGFNIAPIPEPTTFALAGLGAAALLIFRRRN